MTKEWESLFPIAHIYKKPRDMSNHNPLIMLTQQSYKLKSRVSRFELNWLTHPELLPKVKELWLAPTRDTKVLDRVLFKLKKIRKFLKGWGFNIAGARKKRKHVI
jgi:hypothetical protein